MRCSPKPGAGLLFSLAVAGCLILSARPATADDLRVRLDLNGVAQFLFGTEPRMVMVPNTNAYYAQDVPSADVYRVNNTWYTYYQDGWYRSDSYRGTWTRSDADGLPPELARVPDGYHRFSHANRGGAPGGRDGNPDYRYRRAPDGNYNRDPGGDYSRNPDGSYSAIPEERYMRHPDGSYDRHPDGGYDRNSDGSYSRHPENTYDGQDARRPDRGRDGRLDSRREDDASMIRITDAPRMFAVPRSNIYYARDYRNGDLYRYGRNWYINYGGTWYGSRAYTGPWRHVDRDRVPIRIANIPRGYYRTLRGAGTTSRPADYGRGRSRQGTYQE